MSLIAELKRRNAFRVGVAYAIVAWLLIAVASVLLPTFDAPAWVMKAFSTLVILGFPLTLVIAWAFEMTPEGIKRESDVDPDEAVTRTKGRKLDFAIIGLLAVALIFVVVDNYVLNTKPEQAKTTAEQGSATKPVAIEKSVAVLPFVDLSPGGDYEWFSDGLSEEILNSLAHLPELMVSARTSSFHFKGQDKPIGEIAQALGVAHVVEGSVRRSGDQLRVTAQLNRASDGFHLWSETYDRAAADVFAVQEEIAEKIAAALDVVLDEKKRNRMFRTGTRNVQAFEAFQRGRAIYEATHDSGTYDDLFDANPWLERAIALDPGYSAAYLMHADAYFHFLWLGGEKPVAPEPKAPDLTGEQALQHVRADLKNAYETNRDPDAKVVMDYTRTVFSDSWHRLPALIRALDDLHRAGVVFDDEGAWYSFQTSLGDAEAYLAQANSRQSLNPLFISTWTESIIPLIALDRYAEAIETARRARGIAGDSSFLTYKEAQAHAFSGDLDTAIRMFSAGIHRDSVDVTAFQAMASALTGNEREARRLAAEIEAQYPQFDLLWVYHQLGDEEKVARLAHEIDAGPLGPQRLLLSIGDLGNRMAFDLDDTPNLRARLAEMEIDGSRFRPMPRFTPVDGKSDE